MVHEGDFLLSNSMSFGRPYVMKTSGCIHDGWLVLTPDTKRADQDFLYHLLGSPQVFQQFDALAAGSTVRNLNIGLVERVKIPLPPLDEQKRIVEVLDAAFEGLSRARAHTETNLQNARELFELGATEIFRKFAEGYESSPLGRHAEFRNGLNFNQHSKGQEIRYVGVGDFQKNFWIPEDDLKIVQIDGDLSPSDLLQSGDILAVRSNGNRELIGRVMLAGEMKEPTSFSGFTIRIRTTDTEVMPAYVCHFLRTKAMRDLLTEGGEGANISNLNQKLLESLPVKVPEKARQRAAVLEVEKMAEAMTELQSHYRAKLADLDALRQSLLQKAFAGELT
jgi:type I restriction enzyme S subunit